jgi:hypothetical protein
MLAPPAGSYLLSASKRTERKEDAMTTRNAGEAARVGFYFNTRTWEMDLHRKDGGALPGGEGDRYVRVPALALLFLGPVMGFFFVIFLPFIGFALVARELGYRVAGWFGRKAHRPAAAKRAAR